MDKGGKCVHRDRTSLFWLYTAPMKNNNRLRRTENVPALWLAQCAGWQARLGDGVGRRCCQQKSGASLAAHRSPELIRKGAWL